MKTGLRQTIALSGALIFAGQFAPLSIAQSRPVPNAQLASKEVNARADSLLKKMTLDEKIGQLVQYAAGFATGPAQSNVTYDDLVAKGQVGSMLNVVGARQDRSLSAHRHGKIAPPHPHHLRARCDSRRSHHIPHPAGHRRKLGSRRRRDRRTHGAALEARADGIDWVFSPMVDIARDPRWGRIVESNGEDPYLSSAMARAWVKGYQQDDITKPDSVVASVKHFAAYGAAIAGRDYNATDMSEQTLRQVYLPPYRSAVDAGVATVMSSFNSINGVPASANPLTLTQILRKEWGFDGFVVSDWGAVGELKNHSIGDGPTVARKAIEAGLDMDMEGNLFGTTLASQVRSGKIPESVVDEAVRRILRVKFAMGLFDHPYTNPSPAYEASPERRAVARKVADETMVLLKNDPVEGMGALLPLTSKAKKVALIGPLADDARDLLGAWSAGDPKNVITLKQELSQRLGDRLIYSVGCGVLAGEDEKILEAVTFGGSIAGAQNQAPLDDDKSIADAVEAAKQSDVAILALGEPANWMEGEAASRVHLGFTGNQEKLLEAVVATGKPVILVVLSGRPLELKWAAEHVPAILQAWSPGIEAGPAVADVLFGDVNPAGKLPSSFPRAVGQEPLYYAQLPTGRPAGHVDLTHMPSNSQEKFVSRYVDEQNSALFPFGWGLSYTRFHYSTPTLSKSEVPVQEVLSNHAPATIVGVDVTNTGSVAGTEVVQLYIRNTEASVEQPVRELKGFARVELAPGETKHLTFPLGFDELSFYNVEVRRTVEPTTYNIWIGGSSLADQQTEFKVVE